MMVRRCSSLARINASACLRSATSSVSSAVRCAACASERTSLRTSGASSQRSDSSAMMTTLSRIGIR